MIGEVLGVSQEKFHEFIASAGEFINQNEQLIATTAERNPEVVSQLFRNMHTVKGNARTYGLKQLTNIVHETEQAYESLRNPASGVLWNPQMLRQDLEQVTAALARYEKVNDVVLGRKGPGRRGSVERYLMVN